MPRIALYPGSFDPVTNGHLDVVGHAVGLCDRLIVAIGVNSSKKPMFSTDERLEMVEEVFAPLAAAASKATPTKDMQLPPTSSGQSYSGPAPASGDIFFS